MKKFILHIGTLILLMTPLSFLFAQGGGSIPPPEGSTKFPNPLGDITLIGFLNALLDLIIVIAVPIIVLAIIFAGFKFVTAQGKPEELKTAKMVIIWVLIGALIILGAKVIATALQGTVDELKSDSAALEIPRESTLS